MTCNREFLQKDPNEAIEYLNDTVEKAHTWIRPNSVESTNRSRPNASTLSSGGINELKEEDDDAKFSFICNMGFYNLRF